MPIMSRLCLESSPATCNMQNAYRYPLVWRGIYVHESQQTGSGEDNVYIRLTIAWLFFSGLSLPSPFPVECMCTSSYLTPLLIYRSPHAHETSYSLA